jgi:hypothetical protein
MQGLMSNASNTTSKVLTNVSKVVGGGLKGLGAMISSPNNTKAAGKVLTNVSQAIGGGQGVKNKRCCYLINSNKPHF